jgi:hypothetical protein
MKVVQVTLLIVQEEMTKKINKKRCMGKLSKLFKLSIVFTLHLIQRKKKFNVKYFSAFDL